MFSGVVSHSRLHGGMLKLPRSRDGIGRVNMEGVDRMGVSTVPD